MLVALFVATSVAAFFWSTWALTGGAASLLLALWETAAVVYIALAIHHERSDKCKCDDCCAEDDTVISWWHD